MHADNTVTIPNPDHVSIELSCCLDGHLAQMYFDENFKHISGDYLFLYIANGSLPDEPTTPKISTTKNSKNALAEALDELNFSPYSYLEDVKSYTLQELVDELEDQAVFDDDFSDVLDTCNVVYAKSYDTISVRGCNQGDYAEVIIPTDALEKVWGAAVNLHDLKIHISHLFWDAPLYCLIIVDGHEYYASDFWEDAYEYDKGDFISAFMDHNKRLPEPAYVREFLEENLPAQPKP